MDAGKSNETGVWDNHNRGSIGEFLKGKIIIGSELSFVSAYLQFYYTGQAETVQRKFRFRSDNLARDKG